MLRRRATPVTQANPWISQLEDDLAEPQTVGPVASGLLRPSLASPQPGDISPPPASTRLPQRQRSERPALWWLGVHGGAGESTLARLAPGSRPAGHAWPIGTGVPVVLVARSNRTGFACLSAAAREWASSHVAATLLGAVVVADAPGRLPRSLAEQLEFAEGAVPALWCLPWCERWRLELPSLETAPRAVRNLLEDLNQHLTIGTR